MFTFVTPTEKRGKAKNSPMAVLGSHSPANEPTGYCPIGACPKLVNEKQLVCRDCIGLVPDDLIDAYWSTYVKGQTLLTASAENRAALVAIIEFGKSVAA